MEATTLVTAFLICINSKKAAIEAMWKYLIVCSVGIAFAFLGAILVAAATSGVQSEMSDTLFWTKLSIAAKSLNPTLIKASFIFALVGYGTKAGLAPMRTWLPDAHSQAPTPVSTIFSGFMLTTALYCIMRHMALVNRVLGTDGFTNDLMIFFGILSIIVAAAFILVQHDIKRLLTLIGVAPFAFFISELLIVKSAIEAHDMISLVLFLVGSSVVFVAALQHLIPLVWGQPFLSGFSPNIPETSPS